MEEHLDQVPLTSSLLTLLTHQEVLALDLLALHLQVLDMRIIDEILHVVEILRQRFRSSSDRSPLIVVRGMTNQLHWDAELLLDQEHLEHHIDLSHILGSERDLHFLLDLWW